MKKVIKAVELICCRYHLWRTRVNYKKSRAHLKKRLEHNSKVNSYMEMLGYSVKQMDRIKSKNLGIPYVEL